MKVIIVEGLDNTGKSTYIDKLKEHLLSSENLQDTDVMVFHFKPIIGRTNEESANRTDEYNITVVESIINCMKKDKHKYIILDRSWISEFVYGQIYRERNSSDILQTIKDLNEYLTYYIGYENVYLNMFLVSNLLALKALNKSSRYIGLLWVKFSQKTVAVFVTASLPRAVRICKIEIYSHLFHLFPA